MANKAEAKRRTELTQDRLKQLFHYREDGMLIWRIRTNSSCKVGGVAGYKHSSGYLIAQIDGKQYKNHRLVWLWHYGYYPEHEIDHINRNRADNRIENLREATRTCNSRNSSIPCTNTSGVKGVYWNKWEQKWCAKITIAGKNFSLGYHNEFLEAVCHRLAAEQAEGWAGCDSSSPAYKYVQRHANKEAAT